MNSFNPREKFVQRAIDGRGLSSGLEYKSGTWTARVAKLGPEVIYPDEALFFIGCEGTGEKPVEALERAVNGWVTKNEGPMDWDAIRNKEAMERRQEVQRAVLEQQSLALAVDALFKCLRTPGQL